MAHCISLGLQSIGRICNKTMMLGMHYMYVGMKTKVSISYVYTDITYKMIALLNTLSWTVSNNNYFLYKMPKYLLCT